MSEESTKAIDRPEASRRKALKNPDSLLQAQFYFDVDRRETVYVRQVSQNNTDEWVVADPCTGAPLEEISKGQKDARTDAGGRYINLEDVPDDVRQFRTRRGICPSCKREAATDDPEREMTLFVSPDGTDGWVECDQGRGHRYPPTEVVLVAD